MDFQNWYINFSGILMKFKLDQLTQSNYKISFFLKKDHLLLKMSENDVFL